MPTNASPPWLALALAAKHLGLNAEALKKRCQRTLKQTRGGVLESKLAPGIVARKFGRLWLVRFSDGWGEPDNDH